MLTIKISLGVLIVLCWHAYQVQVSGMELGSSGFVAGTFAHVSLNVDGTGAWEMKGSVLGIQGKS